MRTPELARFGGLTVQVYVPEINAGIEFYSRALGRAPNFAPTPDFQPTAAADTRRSANYGTLEHRAERRVK